MIEWAMSKGCEAASSTCVAAAEKGHLQTLKRLRELEVPWHGGVCDGAASNGHLEILEWAMQRGCRVDSITVVNAAVNGQVEVLEWLCHHHVPIPRHVMSDCLEHELCIDVLEWCKKVFELSEFSDAFVHAIERGHVHVLDWAKKQGFQFETKHLYAAYRKKDECITQWFEKNVA